MSEVFVKEEDLIIYGSTRVLDGNNLRVNIIISNSSIETVFDGGEDDSLISATKVDDGGITT